MPGTLRKPIALSLAVLAALLLATVPAHAVAVYILCAEAGSITIPGRAEPVPIWGFSRGTVAAPCGGAPSLPGPTLTAANNELVIITLTNTLSVPVSLMVPGQTVVTVGAGSADTPDSFTRPVPPGGTVGYTFVARTGTYIYESGIDTARQVAMGLHGALRVGPASGLAYPGNGNATFNTEAVLVLSEIDPNLNADPLGFNMQNYAPIYWLINGAAHPTTTPIVAWPGQRLLLRYVNASFNHHAMSLRGLHQLLIAREASRLPTAIQVVSETIPAGTTADAIVVIPAGVGQRFPLYNRNLRLTNGADSAPGGMRTRVEVR